MAEMHRVSVHVMEPAKRPGPGIAILVLAAPAREIRLVSVLEDLGGIGRVADHHGATVGRIDDHLLMADGVTR